MFSWERKAHDLLGRAARSGLFLTAFFTLLGAAVRIPGLGFKSWDMDIYLLPWFEQMAPQGFAALSNQIGDYGIPYQFLMIVATFLPFSPMASIKLISIASDFLLAVSVGVLIAQLTGKRSNFIIGYAAALLAPIAVVNSSVWGQCDSLYTAFAILAVFHLLRGEYGRSFTFLGLSFAFKLQAIFVLPFFIFHYIVRNKFSVAWFGVSLVAFMAASLPGYMEGRSLLDPFLIYLSQTGTYPKLVVSYPSFWSLLGEITLMIKPAIIMTFCILFVGLVALVRQSERLSTPADCLLIASWIGFTCVEFLPSMHERYAYLVVALLFVTCFANRKIIPIAGVMAGIDVVIYGRYLAGITVDNVLLAAVVLTAWLGLTWLAYFDKARVHVVKGRGKAEDVAADEGREGSGQPAAERQDAPREE